MKKILLGAAAAMAIAAPTLAHAETTGVIDLGYQSDDLNKGYSNFDLWHLGGAVQTDLGSSGWTVQLDGNTALQSWDNSSGDDGQGYAAVHADTSMGTWDVGGFVGIQNYYDDGGVILGAETRTAFGNISVQGSLGYGTWNEYNDFTTWDGHVDAAYFFSPNMAVTAGFTYQEVDSDYSPSSDNQTEWSLGGEYQFANGMEVYGGYLNSDNDYSGGYTVDTWNLGVRFHLNGGSLQDYTNHGASWNAAQTISDTITRWY